MWKVEIFVTLPRWDSAYILLSRPPQRIIWKSQYVILQQVNTLSGFIKKQSQNNSAFIKKKSEYIDRWYLKGSRSQSVNTGLCLYSYPSFVLLCFLRVANRDTSRDLTCFGHTPLNQPVWPMLYSGPNFIVVSHIYSSLILVLWVRKGWETGPQKLILRSTWNKLSYFGGRDTVSIWKTYVLHIPKCAKPMGPGAHYSCFLRRIWRHMCCIKDKFLFQGCTPF